MKTAVVFALLVGVAVAQLNAGFDSFNTAATGNTAAGAAPSAAAGTGLGNVGNPWGPKAYGMGLNNPWAVPVNPFFMRRALAVIQNIPNALVRVDVDGELTFTNQYGQEVDITDNFGNDIGELVEF